jgi:hypothetical protein
MSIWNAKAAKVSLDGLCRCVAFARGRPRRAVLERSRACLASGRTALRCVASLSGQRSPDTYKFVSRDDTIQASVAVLSMKMAQRKRATRIASRPLISVLQPCVLDPSISMTRRREDTDRCRTGRFALIQGVSPNHISKSGPRCHPPVSVSCDQLRKARR